VFTITDNIPMPCENHSQIVAAKRVPAPPEAAKSPRVKKQTLFEIFDSPAGLDKPTGTKPGSNNKKRIENP